MQILQTICCVIKCTIKFVWLTCRQNWNTLLSRRRKQLLDLSNDTRKLMHVCSLDVKDSNVYFCYFLVIVFYVLHCMLQYIWCASCHSCNFILSPYYCFVHVDLVVTFFFFFLDKWFSCDLCCICLHFHIQTEFCFHSIIYQSFPVSYLPNIEPVGQPRETKRVPWFIEPPATTLNLLHCRLAPLLEVPLDVGAVVTQAIPMYFEKDSSLHPVCKCVFLNKSWNILGQVLV